MKELMLGNKALARGLYEAGCKVISSYPGTPSTEITEEAALYDEIYCEWAPSGTWRESGWRQMRNGIEAGWIECGSRPFVHELLSGIKCRSGCLRGR